MKNIITYVIVFALILSLVGCGSDATKANTPTETKTAETSVETPKAETKELTLEETLKKSESGIMEVNNNTAGNGYLLIKIKYTSGSKTNITNLCYRLLKVVAVHKDYANLNKIGIMVMADLIDTNGNKSEGKIFAADFEKNKMDKVNWNNYNWKNTLSLGSVTYQHNTVK